MFSLLAIRNLAQLALLFSGQKQIRQAHQSFLLQRYSLRQPIMFLSSESSNARFDKSTSMRKNLPTYRVLGMRKVLSVPVVSKIGL